MKLCTERAYAFTNENLCSYENLYHFEGKKVIAPAASGDQYFTSIFYGAEDVELYDININAWYYFVLKFFGILILSYEEFMQLFVYDKLQNPKLLSKIMPYLPSDVKEYLLKFMYMYDGLYMLIIYSALSDHPLNYDSDRIVPYFDKEKYYILQNKLRNRELPKFYYKDLVQLPNELSNKSYDLLLTSNIYHYLKLNLPEYKSFLQKFPADVIQALYTWILSEEENDFVQNGFELNTVPGVSNYPISFDYVLTLRK